ncbi:polyprenyl synthetase family protein [Candidatus Poribacteria bacterium]|nr:polyprenyl synthetase family protein [Candidatus Poribacteria bacterium]
MGVSRVDFLTEFLGTDLDGVLGHIDTAFDVRGDLMREVAVYVAEGRGKLLRPGVVCLAARAHGLDPSKSDEHLRLGAAIELFHVATLLHDDVIDKASTRRGRPTVNAKWGDDVAILMADYLYATSFDLALSTLDPRALRVLSQTTQRMTEGEFLQIERRGSWLTVEDYTDIIQSKTAHLFAASASLGTLVSGADMGAVERMARFGLEFGLAFQITDDTLDYEAQGASWGKRVGADLADGKQTLPLLHTLEVASPADRDELLHILGNGRDFESVQHFVRKYNAIEYSLEVAGTHCQKACDALGGFADDNEAARLLRRLTEFVLVRQH